MYVLDINTIYQLTQFSNETKFHKEKTIWYNNNNNDNYTTAVFFWHKSVYYVFSFSLTIASTTELWTYRYYLIELGHLQILDQKSRSYEFKQIRFAFF